MQDLLKQYGSTLYKLEKFKSSVCKDEQEIVSGMISDLRFTIEWLRTGKRPGARRGIERRAAYQRERSEDPLVIQRYVRSTADDHNWTDIQQESCVTEWDRTRIEDALSVLTEREKEMYLMSRGGMMSFEQIARMLVVSKSTVQTTIERAEKKISLQISQSLFSFAG
ncbi:sigma-70 family RNA polymerase sigma factor [Bacillus suaedae]|uniref:Sigma-70 family RNA polymerase sigma factor n=1 Tax=Halalkalibacter suaedae TaxID=2822140 RepID=A0A941ASY5_9BACI|nr:sigma-70 family RNA polymerase sigma factor [Bacillus suaedae]MBP3950324.1 sigma-70 family RNA polymerase sigma factor [Bacillus suaedae]